MDDDLHLGSPPLQPHLDLATGGRELERVDEQVRDDLLDADWIAGDRRRRRMEHEIEANPFRFSPRAGVCDGYLDHGSERERPDLKPQRPRNDPGYVEEVLDELRL